MNGQFHAPAPNILWVSDLTYVATWQGIVFVTFVIDVFARQIVGWRASRTANAGFILEALPSKLHHQTGHYPAAAKVLSKIVKNASKI